MMLCPSDDPTSQRTKCSQNNGNWARGNYGANTGLRLWATDSWEHQYRRGVLGVGQALPIGQITDGMSNTTMFLELRTGLIAADPRGTWAMGMVAASSVSCHACNGVYSPNPCETSCGDDDLAGTYSTPVNALGSRVLRECMMICGVGTDFQGRDAEPSPGRRQHHLLRRERPLHQQLHRNRYDRRLAHRSDQFPHLAAAQRRHRRALDRRQEVLMSSEPSNPCHRNLKRGSA